MENKGLFISSIIILCIALFGVVLCTALIGDNPLVSFIEDTVEGVSLHQNVAFASEGIYTPFNGGLYYADVYADVIPATAENKTVTWSVAWEDETIQDDIDDYFDLQISQDTSCCRVICLDTFKNKDAILICRTNVGGYTASCNITWVGNIKALSVDETLSDYQSYQFQYNFYGNNGLGSGLAQYLECDDAVLTFVDYQFGNSDDYRLDRDLSSIDDNIVPYRSMHMLGNIVYGKYNDDSHSWVNTNYSSDYIYYGNIPNGSSPVNYNCPSDYSGLVSLIGAKTGSFLNRNGSKDAIWVQFGWNPYLDEDLWTSGIESTYHYTIRPYYVELVVSFVFYETTSNIHSTSVYYITFDVPSMSLTETSIEF